MGERSPLASVTLLSPVCHRKGNLSSAQTSSSADSGNLPPRCRNGGKCRVTDLPSGDRWVIDLFLPSITRNMLAITGIEGVVIDVTDLFVQTTGEGIFQNCQEKVAGGAAMLPAVNIQCRQLPPSPFPRKGETATCMEHIPVRKPVHAPAYLSLIFLYSTSSSTFI